MHTKKEPRQRAEALLGCCYCFFLRRIRRRLIVAIAIAVELAMIRIVLRLFLFFSTPPMVSLCSLVEEVVERIGAVWVGGVRLSVAVAEEMDATDEVLEVGEEGLPTVMAGCVVPVGVGER